MLFARNYLGDWSNAFYPQALIPLVRLAWPLGLRVEAALWGGARSYSSAWSSTRVAGYWVTGFRNVRHAHIFVYPLALLLTGYLVALRAKRPALAIAAVVVLLVTPSVAAVSTATNMHTAFADGRAACRFLESVPRRRPTSMTCSAFAASMRRRKLYPAGRSCRCVPIPSSSATSSGRRPRATS